MHAVILAGGKGARLWPVSTEKTPKFLIKLQNGKNLLQKTFQRISKIDSIKNIVTVTNNNYFLQIKEHYSAINKHINSEYIIEPSGKDTAAAILSSVMYIGKHYGLDEMVLVVPTDHIIHKHKAFNDAVSRATILAKSGKIITFGINPTYAEENYGYIEYKQNKVLSFKEKPTKEIAKKYLKSGNYLWNSGMLCFSVRTFLDEMKKYCPNIFQIVQGALDSSEYMGKINYREVHLNEIIWQEAQTISIDYALLEKTKKIAVIPCDIEWSDMGNWNSISKSAPTDINGNNIKGNAIAYNVSNCYIESHGKFIAAVGVKNLAIIETENGLLIVDKRNAADVKKISSMINKKAMLAIG
ncbi:MAG: mannose-1-phosphate guanylyltransferase/mannose-6-phosphate isomerase [Rickettsiales bacterium]|nr:MAG: mannose-1-phosphate guanylyltransferase/mannose-6-phosphate isomerase [Rickettsiales bacterium]